MALFPQYQLIKTADGLQLPSFIFPVKNSKKVAILLHGNGTTSTFYSFTKLQAYTSALVQAGIALFAFDNRGANILKHYKIEKDGENEIVTKGTAYELIKECILDIDASLAYLQTCGYEEFYLIGESTGANKICVYDWYKPHNPIAKYVLVAGSDDLGVYYTMLGKDAFLQLLKESEEKVHTNKGEELIPYEQIKGSILSYQSLYDTCYPDGDYNVFPFMECIKHIQLSAKQPLFEKFTHIKKPLLAIYGTNDEFLPGPSEEISAILKHMQRNNPAFTLEWIDGADHSFTEHKDKLSTIIANWL